MEKPLAVLQIKRKNQCPGAKKAATFVKLCEDDAFGVGILTITDTAGFVADLEQGKRISTGSWSNDRCVCTGKCS